jgi:ABC-2 type transport system ATP-binding protein
VLRVDSLELKYGAKKALRGVSFELAAGTVMGLAGGNASGKTSLLSGLAGLLPFSSGAVFLDSTPVRVTDLVGNGQVGYAVDPQRLPADLSGRQALDIVVLARGGKRGDAASRLAERIGLGPWLDQRIGSYSHGTRQKLALVASLVGEPRLVLWDEALNGLDVPSAYAAADFIGEYCRGREAAAIVVSHNLHLLDRVAALVLLLAEGRVAGEWQKAPAGAAEGGLALADWLLQRWPSPGAAM